MRKRSGEPNERAGVIRWPGPAPHADELDLVRVEVSRARGNLGQPSVSELVAILKRLGFRCIALTHLDQLDGDAAGWAEEPVKPMRRSAALPESESSPTPHPGKPFTGRRDPNPTNERKKRNTGPRRGARPAD